MEPLIAVVTVVDRHRTATDMFSTDYHYLKYGMRSYLPPLSLITRSERVRYTRYCSSLYSPIQAISILLSTPTRNPTSNIGITTTECMPTILKPVIIVP